jgi:RNA methyltransferase, TrmH family
MITNNQVKFIHSLQQKKFRELHGVFTAEGSKLVSDLLGSTYKVVELYALSSWIDSHQTLIEEKKSSCVRVSENEMERITGLTSPSPVLGIFSIPVDQILTESIPDDLILMLDGIRDPGNLGTIVRTADWFGIPAILCSENMVDLYNPKVVQATMGSLARVRVRTVNLVEYLENIPESMPVIGTYMEGENIFTCPLPERGILVVGSESEGISQEVSSRVNRRLSIPSTGPQRSGSVPESLNVSVATAIVLAEFRRRRIH